MDELIELKLMEAAENYTVNIRKGYPRVMDETDKYIIAAFEAGAKWYMDNCNKIIVLFIDERTERTLSTKENLTILPSIGEYVYLDNVKYKVIERLYTLNPTGIAVNVIVI